MAGKIVMRFRQPQQRQAAVGMARAQGVERGLGALERGVQRLVGDAVRPDVFFQRAVDGLNHRHGGTLMTGIAGASGRSRPIVMPLDVSPFGRPATVTSMPPL